MPTQTVRFMNIECSQDSAEMGYFAVTGWILFIVSRLATFFTANQAELDAVGQLISMVGNVLIILVSMIAIFKFIRDQNKK